MRRLAGGRERGNARREEEGCSPSRERTRGASRREKRERESSSFDREANLCNERRLVLCEREREFKGEGISGSCL